MSVSLVAVTVVSRNCHYLQYDSVRFKHNDQQETETERTNFQTFYIRKPAHMTTVPCEQSCSFGITYQQFAAQLCPPFSVLEWNTLHATFAVDFSLYFFLFKSLELF